MKYLRHYSRLYRMERDTEILIHYKHGPDKELDDYLDQFKEARAITGFDKVKAIRLSTASLGLKKGTFIRIQYIICLSTFFRIQCVILS